MLPWWHPFDIPLLFDTLSEEAVMRWFSNRHFLGFFFYTRRTAWLSSGRKCIQHELKLMKSNLHWLGQRMWMLYILYQTTQRSTLLVPNSRKWHPKGHWGFWIQCANYHVLGAGMSYVHGDVAIWGWCENDEQQREKRWCFLSTHHVTGTVLSALHAYLYRIHTTTCIIIPVS